MCMRTGKYQATLYLIILQPLVNYSHTYGLNIYVAFQSYLAKEKLSIHLKGKFINIRNSPKLSKSHFHLDGIQVEQVPDSFPI